MMNVLSNDPEFDAEAFERRDIALRNGKCPNDGATLNVINLSERECPICGFSHVVFGGTFETEGDVN